jgi:glycosyltransferase involved in cell wall biosynthesis
MEQATPGSNNAIVVEVNVIVPVHNAEATVQEAVQSVLDQRPSTSVLVGDDKESPHDEYARQITIVIYICCYDDASSDESWSILNAMMQKHHDQPQPTTCGHHFETHIRLGRGTPPARGAGFARNRAVALRNNNNNNATTSASITPQLLCWLDSDDIMNPTRIDEQVRYLLTLPDNALLGTYMERIPADATWHYTQWVNTLTEERVMLERFRELTIIQPTWMMRRTQFDAIGGYLEAPAAAVLSGGGDSDKNKDDHDWYNDWYRQQSSTRLLLPPPQVETIDTLRVAEDLRFFHEHLAAGGTLHLLRKTLVTYRHRTTSQSSQTPRKLLLQLRTLALERSVLLSLSSSWNRFVVWGAGRDGKDFIRSLSKQCRDQIYCLVDVDESKIARGYYETREWKIPVVHFSALAPAHSSLYEDWKTSAPGCHAVGAFSNIHKGKGGETEEESTSAWEKDVPSPSKKKVRKSLKEDPGMKTLDSQLLPSLPVVVCVAMYRSNGALEHNVALIERTEGVNLYHLI